MSKSWSRILGGSVLVHDAKLTPSLGVISEVLRVKSVHFLSERSVGHLGVVLRNLRFATFHGHLATLGSQEGTIGAARDDRVLELLPEQQPLLL